MINPNEVTQYNAPREWQEEFLLFAVCVAGKSAVQQSKKLDLVLKDIAYNFGDFRPMQLILIAAEHGYLRTVLEKYRMGQYTRISKAFIELAKRFYPTHKSVSEATLEELETIPGIGPKTARFFILHTRPGARVAVLDTHILKHLRAHGFTAPKATPGSRKTYLALQEEFIKLADNSGLSVADYDLKVWKEKGIYA